MGVGGNGRGGDGRGGYGRGEGWKEMGRHGSGREWEGERERERDKFIHSIFFSFEFIGCSCPFFELRNLAKVLTNCLKFTFSTDTVESFLHHTHTHSHTAPNSQHTHSSVKNASMIRVPRGLTANSGISIRSCRLERRSRDTLMTSLTIGIPCSSCPGGQTWSRVA